MVLWTGGARGSGLGGWEAVVEARWEEVDAGQLAVLAEGGGKDGLGRGLRLTENQ